MRKKMTLFNSISGLINRIVTIVFVFLVRHFFTQYLNVEYLGFEGFFQNVLGLFSLVDLGLGTAISFDLYEPIHNKDWDSVGSIMALYKKLYVFVGAVVFTLSLCFTPFIMIFMKDVTINNNAVRVYFLIYALGVSISYLFSYKRTLLFASQKNYMVMNVDTVAKICNSIIQIFVLIKLQNYTLYLISIVLVNFMANIVIYFISSKEIRYDTKHVKPLSVEYKNKLKKHISALTVTNIAWQGIVSTDNILISSIIGVIDLAKNANYSTLSLSLNGIVSSVLGGASASIGDLLVENNPNKIKDYFDRYCFVYYIITAYAALGIMFVSRPIIAIWVGEKLTFNMFPVALISLNVFLSLNFKPLADYQNFSGCFVYYKPYSIIALLINLVSSILLGKVIGISGIFLGTTITYIFMGVVVVSIIYKHIFKKSVFDYYIKFLIANLPFFISIIIIGLMLKIIPSYDNYFVMICISFMLVTTVYFGLVVLVLRKRDEYNYFKSYMGTLLRKVIK